MSIAPSRPLRIERRRGYALTNHRALCRRGVLWIGQTCNLRCHFCYFLDKITDRNHPEHDFLPLEKLKQMCKTLVDVYGNNSVDIQGGEPTIYRHIGALIRYCNEIGLKPTLITNGIALANPEKCRELKAAGVQDLLISVHGLGTRYDKIVVVDGAAEKLQKAIENLAAIEIPFRFNCVLCREALPDLMGVATLAVVRGARAVNFIAFNPFVDQSCGGKRSADNVPRYSEVINHLLPVIDYLDDHGIEVNVRYLPFCLFPERYRKFLQNFQQITYDLHEWEAAGEAWSSQGAQREAAAALSEPIDFFKYIEVIRLRVHGEQSGAAAEAERWSPSIRATLDRLEARVAAGSTPVTVSLFGSTEAGVSVRRAAGQRPTLRDTLTFAAFISTDRYRTDETLHGLPWRSPAWLAAHPTDLVINTSESSRAAIRSVLQEHELGARAIELFGTTEHVGAEATTDAHPLMRLPGRAGYEYRQHLPELGPVAGAGVLDEAYKEFRVLMPKAIHPYAKGDACANCSLHGICDGFHRDYVEIFGFDEAKSVALGGPVYDACFYSSDQMKVVEEQEYSWALPEVWPLTPAPRLAAAIAVGDRHAVRPQPAAGQEAVA